MTDPDAHSCQEDNQQASPVLLVATDLNDLERLMPFAFQQAHQSDARLILLHVLAASASSGESIEGMPLYDPSEALDYASKSMHPWCEMARRQELTCNALLREGPPAQQIVAAARQFNASRILLGTRGLGRLRRMTLGSVAEQVLRSADIPVITVGPEAHLGVESSDRQRLVVYATTLRHSSRPSAALACQIAARSAAKLLIVHVLPPAEELHKRCIMPAGALARPLEEQASEELAELANQTQCTCGLEAETLLVHGNPTIEILATAAERNAYLLVMGAHSHTGLAGLTRDRTLYRVLAHARSPVLTLREPSPAETEEGTLPLAMQF